MPPMTLLPASAAAFAPRGSPNVVLGSKPEAWLTATLKRINRIKRPLNNVSQHHKCLTETLSGPSAIWTLCSIMLPKAPDSELRKDDNPLIEALFNYQLLHIEAYVVHVDMVSQNEVAFKLTPETIESLVEYHKDIFSVDSSANTWNWSEKEVQLKKLQGDFVQATNKFVFRAGVMALEGLEEDGAGELLAGGAEDVKGQIMGLFLPLLPPPPRQPEPVRPAPILPSSSGADSWWPSTMPSSQSQDSWKMLPPSPSATSSCDSNTNMWTNMSMGELQLPSPAPSFSQPYTTGGYCEPTTGTYCEPTTGTYCEPTTGTYCEPTTGTYCESTTGSYCVPTTGTYCEPATASYCEPEYYSIPMSMSFPMSTSMSFAPVIPSLPMPSMLAQQCSTSAGFGGFGGFGWDRYNEYTMPYATTM